jgi:hypothetical protein
MQRRPNAHRRTAPHRYSTFLLALAALQLVAITRLEAQAPAAPPSEPTSAIAPPSATPALVPSPVAPAADNPSPGPAPETAAAPTGQASGVLLPPPPPGYVYMATPSVSDERRAADANELQQIESRLTVLKHERARHGIAGPIALMAGGYAIALGCSLFALGAFGNAEEIERLRISTRRDDVRRYDFNNDDLVNHEDEDIARRTSRVMGALSVVGAGVGLFGTLFFQRRNAKRNEHKEEITALKNRRRELMRTLRYSANVGAGSLGIGFTGTF